MLSRRFSATSIQMAPKDLRTYSSFHPTPSPPPKHTPPQDVPKVTNSGAKDFAKMAFLLQRGQKEPSVGKRREPSTRALLPGGWGVLSYTTGGKGVTQLSKPRRSTVPPTRSKSALGTPSAADPIAGDPPVSSPPPGPRPPARARLPRQARPVAPRGRRGAAAPSRPASPARAHTYCCRGCRSRRGAAGPGG